MREYGAEIELYILNLRQNSISMKKLFVTALCLTAFTSVFCQSNIKGILIDEGQNTVIEYANVALYQQKDSSLVTGTVSSPDGSFEIKNVKPGNYYLIAQFMGYNSKTIDNIEVSKNQNVNLNNIQLSANQKLLDEIEVTGEKVTTVNKIDRQVYAADQFESAKGGNATDLIRNMPSVNVNALGEISVRGTSGFVVLLNGKPIQTDASAILNQLPANAIENIEIVTAPSAKYDPEGKAGLINIITKKGATDGLFLQFNSKVGLPSIEDYDNKKSAPRYGGDFSLNYHKEKWDISAGASYLRNDISGRRVGNVYTIIEDTKHVFPSEGERSFDEINYSGRFTVGFTPDKNNSINVGFFGGKRSKDRQADIVYYDNHALSPANSSNRIYEIQYYNENLRTRKSDFVLGSVDYKHTFENKSELNTSFLYEYTLLGGPTTNLNLGYPDTKTVYQDEYNTNDNPLNGTRLLLDYKSKPLSIGTIEAGYQYRNLDHTGDFVYDRLNNETKERELITDFSSSVNLKRQIHSVYSQLSGKKGKTSYGVGLRVEMMDRELELQDKAGSPAELLKYDFIKPFPSANIQYEINDELRLKAAYSRRVERTTTFKMNPFPEREHSETLEQGDKNLLPEFADIVEVGVVKDFKAHSVFATAYYRNTTNLINRVNTIYNDSILNRIYSNVGTGRSLGLELGADLKPAPWWKVFIGANIYNYDVEGQFKFDPVFGGQEIIPVSSSSTVYSINTNTTFTLAPTLSIQWSVNYLSKRNTAQGEDSRFLSPNLSVKKSWMDNRLSATVQWLNMDMGLWDANEQRISTWRENEFYTTTNYIYEVDVIMINISYTINRSGKKGKFIQSEFGAQEF